MLREQRGKDIGARAINFILRKNGLSTGRSRQGNTSSHEAFAQGAPVSPSEGIGQQQQQEVVQLDGEMPGPAQPGKRRDHRRPRTSQDYLQKQPKAISQLSQAALTGLARRCWRDPSISNEDLQRALLRLGVKIPIMKLESIRKRLEMPRQ